MKVIQSVLRHQSLAHTEKYVPDLGIDIGSAISTLEQSMVPEDPTQVPTRLHLMTTISYQFIILINVVGLPLAENHGSPILWGDVPR